MSSRTNGRGNGEGGGTGIGTQAVLGVSGAGVGVAAVPPGLPPAAGSSPAAAVEAVSGLRGSEESCLHLESFPWPGSETPSPGEKAHVGSRGPAGAHPPQTTSV